MASGNLHGASELSPQVREALESLIGRPLEKEESVSVRVYRPAPAPTGVAREEAYRRLLDRADRTAAKAAHVPETDVDAAIEEAADFVRHRRSE
jgi:hypothetical protein